MPIAPLADTLSCRNPDSAHATARTSSLGKPSSAASRSILPVMSTGRIGAGRRVRFCLLRFLGRCWRLGLDASDFFRGHDDPAASRGHHPNPVPLDSWDSARRVNPFRKITVSAAHPVDARSGSASRRLKERCCILAYLHHRTYVSHLECSRTGERLAAGTLQNLSPVGAPLLVRYDLATATRELDRSAIGLGPDSLWRYAPLLPLRDPTNRVTFDEGWTPLLPTPRLGERIGSSRCW